MKPPEIRTLPLGELDTNCYLIWCPDTLEAILIDPADAGDHLSEEILRRNLKLSAILLTHGHFDHVLGLLDLRLNFDDTHIFLHADDMFLIKDAQKSAQHWLRRETDPIPPPTHFLTPQSAFSFGKYTLTTIETPGHTPGSVTFVLSLSPEETILFVGDTLFKNGVGRTDFSYASAVELEKSLEKLIAYPSNTVVYPGHGSATTIGEEKISLGY